MFKKAERKQIPLKIAITGPTGSGKTYSALRLTKGLGGKTAYIDTENRSASLYSEKFDFDVANMTPPFTTEKYIAAIEFAEKNGYQNIVIDSLTHAWAGEGGLLEQKSLLDSRPNSNHWTNWGPIDKKDQALKNAFLHSPCNIIATMRSKMDYAQSEEGGKKKVQKVGLAPIQRDGLSYEFTVVFDVAMDHQAETSKDRTGLFTDRIFKITEETGNEINTWLASGGTPETVAPKAPPAQTSQKPVGPAESGDTEPQGSNFDFSNEGQQPDHVPSDEPPQGPKGRNEAPISMTDYAKLYELAQKQRGWSKSTMDGKILAYYKLKKPTDLKKWQFDKLCESLEVK